MIEDNFSAEDLALPCIKLGAEKIYISSRKSEGIASYMGSWPEDKVEILDYSQVNGVKEDGTGRTIMFDTLEEDDPIIGDAEDVSIIIFCTGYEANLDFVDKKLLPWVKNMKYTCGTWRV